MTGYVRQSSAEIVTGQVIEASDFNNEFDRLLAAFSGTTGHTHDGTTGNAPPINLTSTSPGVSGILDAQFGGIHSAAASPATTDCTPSYVKGSIWVNTTLSVAFICVDNTLNAAVWKPLPNGINGSGASAPTVNDDTTKGYRVGSVYVETATPSVYVATSVGTGAAVWQSVTFNVGFAAMVAQVFG